MGFCLLSHLFKFPDTPDTVCRYLKGRGKGFRSPPRFWCRVCTMCCDVRFTTRLLWCRQHCPLIGQYTHVPGPLIGRIKGVTVKGSHWNHFKFSATLALQASPDKAVEHCKIPWESPMNSQQFFSQNSVRPISAHGPGTLTPLSESHEAQLSAAKFGKINR